jgi:hypothetical protein
MKRLLVLVIIACLTTLAKGLDALDLYLQISANGDTNPANTEYWLYPNETIELAIYAIENYDIGDEVYFALVCDPALGTISGGIALIPPAPDLSKIMLEPDLEPYFPGKGIYGYIGGLASAPWGVYFDEIIFPYESIGDAVVQLWICDESFEDLTLADYVVIHQIPEPATIVLLSLGGLLLRKRK